MTNTSEALVDSSSLCFFLLSYDSYCEPCINQLFVILFILTIKLFISKRHSLFLPILNFM